MEKIAVIINGKREIRDPLRQWLEHLKSLADLVLLRTEAPGHAITLVQGAISNGYEKIIAAGGDGTLHEVINGLRTSEIPETPCLFIPNGTANDWGRTVPPPDTLAKFLERLSGTSSEVDIGEIIYTDQNDLETRRYFINIADTGMGADVVERVNRRRFGKNSHLVFLRAILMSFLHFKNGHADCIADGKLVHSGLLRLLVIANGKYFGSGICISPESRVNDHKLELIIIGNVNLFDYLRYLPALRKGRLINHPEVHYLSARHVHVRTPDLATEADGEYIGTGNMQFRIIPGGINLL